MPSQSSSPSSRRSSSAADGRIADDTDLGEAEQLGRRERARRASLPDAPVRDQLHDRAGRIVEVDRLRIPVREVEHDITGLGVGEQLDPVVGPGERCLEAVARHEQGEVVERSAAGGTEFEHRLPHLDGHGYRPPAARAGARAWPA